MSLSEISVSLSGLFLFIETVAASRDKVVLEIAVVTEVVTKFDPMAM